MADYKFDIFLSFSSSNKHSAQDVSIALRNAGLRVFLSSDSLKHTIGTSFAEKISEALENSQHFVMLCTPEAMNSGWVKVECDSFFNHCRDGDKRRLIILKGKNFDERTLPFIYRNFQYAEHVEDVIYTLGIEQINIIKNKSAASATHIQTNNTAIENAEIKNAGDKSVAEKEDNVTASKPNNAFKTTWKIVLISAIVLLTTLGLMLKYPFKKGQKIETPPVVTLLPDFDSSGTRWGFKDLKCGKNIIPLQFDWVDSIRNGVFRFCNNRKFGLGDSTGKILIPATYDYIDVFQEGRAKVKQNKKEGFIDDKGKLIVAPKYDFVENFKEGMAVIRLGKYGYINKEGIEIVKPKYDYAHDFENGFAEVSVKESNDSKNLFINKSGIEITKPIYDLLFNFKDDRALFKRNGRYGYLNQEGKEVIEPLYDQLGFFSNGLATFCINNKWGAVDRSGAVKIDPIYTELGENSEGLMSVKINGKVGYMNANGKIVIQPKYTSGQEFKDGLAEIEMNNKYGYIDKEGNEVVKPIYFQLGVNGFVDGLAAAGLNSKCGYIDKGGQVKIPFKFDYAEDFYEGFAIVWVKDKKGVIDVNGNLVGQPIYDDITNLDYSGQHTAIVQLNKKWGCINLEAGGTPIGDIIYDKFENFHEGLAAVTLNGKVGFIDLEGHMVIPAIYDDADNLSNGLIFVVKGKEGFYINRLGVQVTN